ncbi:hypothetical protein B7494_g5913 [Chlorociboria aeruginascens]|nr:hypothetical protein B7494_g5913 [Chlorociboria aeruginascens]
MVYLTRSEKLYQSTCLKAARFAIFLLDRLVSNSNEVFNGIVWQLLYSPFMPYFVVFTNIISDPHSSQCFDDLKLLRQVVLYFLQMDGNHKSACKMERVAETFISLAKAYVRHSMRGSRLHRNQPLPLNFFSISNFDGSLPGSDIPMDPQYLSLKAFESNRNCDEQILDELESRAQNFALDGTFDWISWDVYDQDASDRR